MQRELMKDMILDVAYVGQHSQNLRTNYDGENILNPKYFSLRSPAWSAVRKARRRWRLLIQLSCTLIVAAGFIAVPTVLRHQH